MTTINISFISHALQRYDTVGDWYYIPGTDILKIVVSSDHPEYSTKIEREAVALHELVEALLCGHAGITQKQVDDFDFKFTGTGEPGEELEAPYRRQHNVADIVERIYIHEATSYNHTQENKETQP
jgi:hypothetical protein